VVSTGVWTQRFELARFEELPWVDFFLRPALGRRLLEFEELVSPRFVTTKRFAIFAAFFFFIPLSRRCSYSGLLFGFTDCLAIESSSSSSEPAPQAHRTKVVPLNERSYTASPDQVSSPQASRTRLVSSSASRKLMHTLPASAVGGTEEPPRPRDLGSGALVRLVREPCAIDDDAVGDVPPRKGGGIAGDSGNGATEVKDLRVRPGRAGGVGVFSDLCDGAIGEAGEIGGLQ
jgi:hypothetical protein